MELEVLRSARFSGPSVARRAPALAAQHLSRRSLGLCNGIHFSYTPRVNGLRIVAKKGGLFWHAECITSLAASENKSASQLCGLLAGTPEI